MPFRAIDRRSGMWSAVRQLLGPEDARLVVVAVEGLMLEEAVDAVNFKLEVVNALLNLDVSYFRLGVSHLQGNQVLLIVLLRVDHPALKAATATFDLVGEAGLHLLELIVDEADGGIDGVCGGTRGGGIGGIRGLGRQV
jgi:hypothetical protein